MAPKKKQRNNPLRNARSSAGSNDARDIWFRKSSTGSSLFLEYYAAQPIGTVCCCSLPDRPQPRGSVGTKRGMSRAAQRKRKKRCKTGMEAPAEQRDVIVESSQQDAAAVVDTTKTSDPTSHLWNTWKEMQASSRTTTTQLNNMEPFVRSMSSRLPVTLRIRSTADSDAVRGFLADKSVSSLFSTLSPRTDVLQAPLAKDKLSPEVKASLLHYSTHGVVARQELGSMLPLLALEEEQRIDSGTETSIKAVLDMCASPGSKTLQAWECLETSTTSSKKSFLLVANDVHQRRLDAMQEAIQRSGVSPASSPLPITYTCQDAKTFALRTASGKLQRFDRILCDVPCSGDGTCRKDRHILPQWKPDISNRLHATQLAILCRGLALLLPGGRLCYSTCSLNPVENEAVVAAALQQHTEFELVDVTIPGVQLRDGLTGGWKVARFSDDSDTGIEWLERPLQRAVDTPLSLWPPVQDMPCLSMCKRLWPQDQESGGFFLAVFRYRNDAPET